MSLKVYSVHFKEIVCKLFSLVLAAALHHLRELYLVAQTHQYLNWAYQPNWSILMIVILLMRILNN